MCVSNWSFVLNVSNKWIKIQTIAKYHVAIRFLLTCFINTAHHHVPFTIYKEFLIHRYTDKIIKCVRWSQFRLYISAICGHNTACLISYICNDGCVDAANNILWDFFFIYFFRHLWLCVDFLLGNDHFHCALTFYRRWLVKNKILYCYKCFGPTTTH